MRKKKIKSPFAFLRKGEWNVLCHLFKVESCSTNDIRYGIPHAQYDCGGSDNVTSVLVKKGMVKVIDREHVSLTPAGRAIVKDGIRLVRKFGKIGIDITNPHVEPGADSV
jgi:hypothetical protein